MKSSRYWENRRPGKALALIIMLIVTGCATKNAQPSGETRMIEMQPFYQEGPIKIQWLGTAGFILSTKDETILIDPYLTRNPNAQPKVTLALADLSNADWIFITHGHFDHTFDIPELARTYSAQIVASPSVCEILKKNGVPGERLRPLNGGESIKTKDFSVKAIPSRHIKFDVPLVLKTAVRIIKGADDLDRTELLSLARKWPCGDVLGYMFEKDNHTILHFGSGGYYEDEIKGLKSDILLLPLQGNSDIHSIGAEITALIEPKKVIPHHWDSFYPPLSQTIPVEPYIQKIKTLAPGIEIILLDVTTNSR